MIEPGEPLDQRLEQGEADNMGQEVELGREFVIGNNAVTEPVGDLIGNETEQSIINNTVIRVIMRTNFHRYGRRGSQVFRIILPTREK